eukprot:Clim_evm11s201 gene=Clim_evmTU11s201
MPYLMVGRHPMVGPITIHYKTWGHGPTKILFIQGLAMQHEGWNLQIDYFSQFPEKYEICAIDNRGVGKSSAISPGLTTGIMANDARKVIDHLGWRKVHICGISMGGMITLEFACQYYDRCESVTLVNTHGGGVTSFPPLTGMFRGAKVGVMSPFAYLGLPQLRKDALLELLVGADHRRNPEKVKFLNSCNVTSLSVEISNPLGFVNQVAAIFMHYVSSGRLKRVKEAGVPILIFAAIDDSLVRPLNSVVLQPDLGARLHVFTDAGHGLPIDEPEAFNHQFQDFVETVEDCKLHNVRVGHPKEFDPLGSQEWVFLSQRQQKFREALERSADPRRAEVLRSAEVKVREAIETENTCKFWSKARTNVYLPELLPELLVCEGNHMVSALFLLEEGEGDHGDVLDDNHGSHGHASSDIDSSVVTDPTGITSLDLRKGRFLAHLERVLRHWVHRNPRLRQRLYESGKRTGNFVGSGTYHWLSDPNFRIKSHMRWMEPDTKKDVNLQRLTVRLLNEPMRGDMPLWDVLLFDANECLPVDRENCSAGNANLGMLVRIHYALSDAEGCNVLLEDLLAHGSLESEVAVSRNEAMEERNTTVALHEARRDDDDAGADDSDGKREPNRDSGICVDGEEQRAHGEYDDEDDEMFHDSEEDIYTEGPSRGTTRSKKKRPVPPLPSRTEVEQAVAASGMNFSLSDLASETAEDPQKVFLRQLRADAESQRNRLARTLNESESMLGTVGGLSWYALTDPWRFTQEMLDASRLALDSTRRLLAASDLTSLQTSSKAASPFTVIPSYQVNEDVIMRSPPAKPVQTKAKKPSVTFAVDKPSTSAAGEASISTGLWSHTHQSSSSSSTSSMEEDVYSVTGNTVATQAVNEVSSMLQKATALEGIATASDAGFDVDLFINAAWLENAPLHVLNDALTALRRKSRRNHGLSDDQALTVQRWAQPDTVKGHLAVILAAIAGALARCDQRTDGHFGQDVPCRLPVSAVQKAADPTAMDTATTVAADDADFGHANGNTAKQNANSPLGYVMLPLTARSPQQRLKEMLKRLNEFGTDMEEVVLRALLFVSRKVPFGSYLTDRLHDRTVADVHPSHAAYHGKKLAGGTVRNFVTFAPNPDYGVGIAVTFHPESESFSLSVQGSQCLVPSASTFTEAMVLELRHMANAVAL